MRTLNGPFWQEIIRNVGEISGEYRRKSVVENPSNISRRLRHEQSVTEQSVTPLRFTSSVGLIPRRSYQSCQEVIKNVPVVPHTRLFVVRAGFSGRPKEALSPDPLQQEQHLCGR